MPEFRKFVWAYGVETSRSGKEYIGDCPFCSKEGHFFVNDEKHLWDCKHCGESGNHITFLNRLWEESSGDPKDLEPLAEERGLKLETLQWASIKKSHLTGEYLLPVWNAKGNLVNLYHRDEESGKILSSPSPCKHQMYLADRIRKNPYLLICEGHWDALAMAEMLQRLQYRGDRLVSKAMLSEKETLWPVYDVVGVPGSTTFPEQWLPYVKSRDVVLLYDNDEGGQKGIRKVIKTIQESTTRVNSLQVLQWTEDDPNDIRDLLLAHRPRRAWEHITTRLTPVETEEGENETEAMVLEPETCETFGDLLSRYRNEFQLTSALEDTLATMLAVALSVGSDGEQLGLRVVGPPGSGKSTLAECLGVARSLVYQTSKFTGLISGFGMIKKGQQIAQRINGKNLMIKDADVMTQMANWHQVESEIRDALGDGVIRAEYKTGKSEEIYVNFSVTMCGTRRLLRIDDAQLGSRFVNIFIQEDKEDTKNIVAASLKSQLRKMQKSVSGKEDNTLTHKGNIQELGPPTAGFLIHKNNQIPDMQVLEPSELRVNQITEMAYIIAWSRARVSREGADTLSFRPELENPTRVANQLFRIGTMLALVFSPRNKITLGKRVTEVLQRITRDTAFGFHFEVMETLYSFPEGLTAEQLGARMKLSVTQMRNMLRDMHELEIVEKQRVKNVHGRGRRNHFYVLTNQVRESYKIAFSKR